ncbi:helix-turn-helix protein [Comamonas sp. BIGb0124]|uniref:helix-turn-helix domain-containing protein n=1 Tax=Comamonas sp. BIGb0124 TaxID=2485130 RepID=UPI000F496F05|nr:helix-turn-helix transcriptional regulator [Comamonas sp. BIGb0124]ROR24656.1 helix-turn-helix protein [Comamonas sp. BIGb0124]
MAAETYLLEIGERLTRLRLSRNLTQATLAREAGASVSSIKRLEAGENTSLDTFLRVLGALGLDERLSAVLPDPEVRPVERVRHGGRERRRAREKAVPAKATDWAWGEEDEA